MEPAGTTDSSNIPQFSLSKVRVVVRVRPFLPQEISARSERPVSCVSVLDQGNGSDDEVTVFLKDQFTRKECYKLDSFYGKEDNNVRHIFDREVKPMIPGIFHGCNATIFAYGATGSGKTYTMQGTDELPGLMSSAMSIILSMCEKTGSTAEISYYEVYMDRCYDLLRARPHEIAILDGKDGQIHLRGLSRVSVRSMSDFNEAFLIGVQKRKVAHTGLNDVSSRSHGALVISVTTPCSDSSEATVVGKLNLIDLAGNEDNRRTCNEGIRIQESAKINQSLFALSNVIYALNNNKSRVPYRESKLTRILQDSLGGTSRALMVACLNPGEYQESVHTVSLAARSRHVANIVPSAQKQETPKVKVDMEAKLRIWLESRGKTKNANRFSALGSPPPGNFSSASGIKRIIDYHISAKTKTSASTKKSVPAVKRVILVPGKNLFENEDLGDSFSQSFHEDQKKENADSEVLPSLGEPSREDRTNALAFATQVSENSSTTHSPLRKALSPINGNLNEEASTELVKDQQHFSFFGVKTPGKSYVGICTGNLDEISTPLDKFNECSSNLKANLIKEYIDFLNVASREELLELKGVGPKRADHILKVRGSSPFRTLNDLEKIGLSSKQVQDLLRKAATSVFV